MKRVLHLVVLLFISINLFAQAPQKMTYQAVIRNSSNNLVVSSPVKMKISILQGSTTGTVVYSEEHNPTTNANGLVSIEIGEGTNKTGTFSTIDWGNGTYFLKTEADPTNGNNLSIVGTSQLLSVPYALNANCINLFISPVGDTVKIGCSSIILPGASQFNYQNKVKIGLIGWWNFDDGNANDYSGNGYNGIVNGATVIAGREEIPGVNTGAYLIDNLAPGITVKNFSMNPMSFTCNYWVYYLSQPTNTSIADISHDWLNNGSFTTIRQLNSTLSFGTPGSNGTSNNIGITSSSINELNKWINFTVVRDGEIIKLYKNGILSATGINKNITPTIVRDLFFGGDPGNISINPNARFRGKIDDIRIYNRPLTQEEITWLANDNNGFK